MKIGDYIKKKSKDKGATQLTPEEMVEKYSSMDEASLMGELFKTANESRARGELDNKTLDDFYQKVSPLLTPEQKERMAELISGLKI